MPRIKSYIKFVKEYMFKSEFTHTVKWNSLIANPVKIYHHIGENEVYESIVGVEFFHDSSRITASSTVHDVPDFKNDQDNLKFLFGLYNGTLLVRTSLNAIFSHIASCDLINWLQTLSDKFNTMENPSVCFNNYYSYSCFMNIHTLKSNSYFYDQINNIINKSILREVKNAYQGTCSSDNDRFITRLVLN